MIGLKFGNFNLQSGGVTKTGADGLGVTVTGTDVYSAPQNKIQADTLAESDGALIVKQQYTSKTFSVEGYLRADTIAALEALIDRFKVAMSQKNQGFDLDYAGGVRRYLASYQNMIIAKRSNTTASFSVELLSPDGMGWDVDSTALIEPTGLTSSNVTLPIDVGGSYMAEPIIQVALNTVTGGTNRTVSISNATTLRGMAITRDWAAGDMLEINSLKKTVYVNGIVQEFTGQFPSFAPGIGALQYVDDLGARDATIQASYTRRWL